MSSGCAAIAIADFMLLIHSIGLVRENGSATDAALEQRGSTPLAISRYLTVDFSFSLPNAFLLRTSQFRCANN